MAKCLFVQKRTDFSNTGDFLGDLSLSQCKSLGMASSQETHPTLEEMEAFCRDSGSESESRVIDQHISYCAKCSREMARMVRQLVEEEKQPQGDYAHVSAASVASA